MHELAIGRELEPAPPLPVELPDFLKLVADVNRLRILALLVRGERCVCDVEAMVHLPQNLVSHHLAVLKRAGMVCDRRQGKWVYYRVDSQALATRLASLLALLESRHAERQAIHCDADGAS